VRSNINLLINLAYILFHRDPSDAAKNFWAYSFRERERYLHRAHGVPEVPSGPPMPIEEINRRVGLWPTKISDRAKAGKLPPMYYEQGYKLFSSLEHSDPIALLGYVEDWDTEVGPTIEGASGRDIDLALTYNSQVVADLLEFLIQHLKVPADDIRRRIGELSKELYRGEDPSAAC
jgi:hypothetical protein